MKVIEQILTGLNESLVKMGTNLGMAIPGIITGVIVLAVGYIISVIIGGLIRKLFKKIGLDKKIAQLGLSKSIGNIELSNILGIITKWYIFLIFAQQAMMNIALGAIGEFIGLLLTVAPLIISGALLMIGGLLTAGYIGDHIKKLKFTYCETIAAGARLLIIYLALVIALGQVGFDTSILTNLVTIIMGSLGLGFSLAIGLSFGLGGKEKAAEVLKTLKIRKWIKGEKAQKRKS